MVRAEPFQLTVEGALKFVPFAVSVKAEVPAIVVVGEIELRVGAGGAFTVTVLLSAEVTPEEDAQILIASAAEYCIAV